MKLSNVALAAMYAAGFDLASTGKNKFSNSRHIRYHGSTYFPPNKRNGGKECQRRIDQGLNGTCYIHGAQYPSYMR